MSSQRDLVALRNTYQVLLEEVNRLTLVYTDLNRSIETLETFKKLKEKGETAPVMVPVGGFLSVIMDGIRVDKVAVQVGAGIYVEMPPEEALEELKKRLEEVKENILKMQVELRQIEAQLISAERVGGAKKGTS